MELSKGSKVWVHHDSQVWIDGEVMESEGGRVQVRSHDGHMLILSPSDLHLKNPDILIGANDLTSLSHLHEPAVLHNLKVRFQNSGTIYTYCGIVLVAVNPYQPLPIYGSEIAAAYSGRQMGDLDPHIFAIAEEAYAQLARERCSQSIIVSGESGAGKTVSAKYTMSYFAAVGGTESHDCYVDRKVLASNPIMEAIGNARTTRNDNSSRFGKYIQIRFNDRHQITGAHMSTYLLEKSRCVRPSSGERNYHIFYQLCSCWEEAEFGHLRLSPPTVFRYTSQGGCVQIYGVNDQSEFRNTREALRLLGFHDNQEAHIFRVLAAILHLGNISVGVAHFGGEDIAAISLDDGHMTHAAELLGVDRAQLRLWLAHRLIVTARESLKKPLSPAQAVNARDGLSKHLYAHLFEWVVTQINQSLSSRQSHDQTFIGVLDIYGFEVFSVNSFEQFCINYANEKLQQQFNQHVFKLEQQEYVREAIEWSFIDYHDNQPTIDLIESKLGILDLLDETCRMPSSSDALFIQKLYSTHLNHTPSFSKPRTSTQSFCVGHYAGRVEYLNSGFVGKNRDSVITEHISLVRGSKHQLVAQLFSGELNIVGGIKKETVGAQFRSSLSQLMNTLSSTTPHYVRCVKPNDNKAPFTFDPHRVVQQLRACGVLETVRISAAGYPSRWLYRDFALRYRMLGSKGQQRGVELKNMAQEILEHCVKDRNKYQLGRTKVFFRAGGVAYLEKLRSHKLHMSGLMIQKHIRGWSQRRRYLALRAAAVKLQALVRAMAARRRVWFLRQTRAAVVIQKHVRCFVAQRKYMRLQSVCLAIQTHFRGGEARKRYRALVLNHKATVIQTAVRGWLARQRYQHDLHSVVVAQCCVRRWRAKRELRALKIEARSVDRLKVLNKGLEIKIIQLQQKLTDQINQNNALVVQNNRLQTQLSSTHQTHLSELEQAKLELIQLQSALETERVTRTSLEDQLVTERLNHASLEEQLNAEREEHRRTLERLAQLEEEGHVTKGSGHVTQETESVIESKDHVTTKAVAPPVTEVSITEDSLDAKYVDSLQSPLVQPLPPVNHTPITRLNSAPPIIRTPLHSTPTMKPQSDRHGNMTEMRESIRRMLSEVKSTPLPRQGSKVSLETPGGASVGEESLPEEALTGLRQAFDLINTLTAINVQLQDEVARVTQENLTIREMAARLSASAPVTVHKKHSHPLTPLSPRRHDNPPPRRGFTLKTRPHRLSVSVDSVGMIKWHSQDLGQVVSCLVTNMTLEKLTNQIPCLPAHMIFMCLRYTDHLNNEEQAVQLMEGVVNSLHQVTHRNHSNLGMLSFWLANTCRLTHNLKQFSGQQDSACGLMNFDLTEYQHILTHRALAVYHQITELIHSRLKHLIVPGLVEHESIPGITTSRPMGMKWFFKSPDKPSITVEMVVKEINIMVATLKENYVDPEIISQLIRQIFFVVNATMLNNLLLRRELCHWSKGVQMRYNLSQLEDWAREMGAMATPALPELLPIVEATKLLQIRKSADSHAHDICDHCSNLNALQVQKILSMYSPADEYEERVPSSLIRLVAKMSGADQVDPNSLMIDVHRFYPIELAFVECDIHFPSLRIPRTLLGKHMTVM